VPIPRSWFPNSNFSVGPDGPASIAVIPGGRKLSEAFFYALYLISRVISHLPAMRWLWCSQGCSALPKLAWVLRAPTANRVSPSATLTSSAVSAALLS
jgi:hypothetical protein